MFALVRFVVAGGGVAGLAAALAVARAGHQAIVLERDAAGLSADPMSAFGEERRGIPALLSAARVPPARTERADELRAGRARRARGGGRRAAGCRCAASRRAGAGRRGSRLPLGPTADHRVGAAPSRCAGSRRSSCVRRRGSRGSPARTAPPRAAVSRSTEARLSAATRRGRPRPLPAPEGWRRRVGEQADCGALYYCRYFELRDGVEHLDGGPQNPLEPARRPRLHGLQHLPRRQPDIRGDPPRPEPATASCARCETSGPGWRRAHRCATLDVMTSADYGRPITGVMPMGGLLNVDCTGEQRSRRARRRRRRLLPHRPGIRLRRSRSRSRTPRRSGRAARGTATSTSSWSATAPR